MLTHPWSQTLLTTHNASLHAAPQKTRYTSPPISVRAFVLIPISREIRHAKKSSLDAIIDAVVYLSLAENPYQTRQRGRTTTGRGATTTGRPASRIDNTARRSKHVQSTNTDERNCEQPRPNKREVFHHGIYKVGPLTVHSQSGFFEACDKSAREAVTRNRLRERRFL
jgi:hypothetical protein